MRDPGRFEHLRHAALDMLDAGNSEAAVAGLLGVPGAVVARWRDEPVPPRPDPAAQLAAASAQGRPMRFDERLTYGASLMVRLWSYLLAVFVASAFAMGWTQSHEPPLATWAQVVVVLVDIGIAVIVVLVLLYQSRPILVLETDVLIVPGLVRKRTMPYSELLDYWLVMHVRHENTEDEREGRLLTLHWRGVGVEPSEVFIDDRYPLDPRVIERLDLVKKANQGVHALTRLGSAASA